MAYLGTKPANAVLTSEQIGDGVIATSDLANGAVTQDKLSTYIAPKGTPAFSAYQNSSQSISNFSWTKVQINTKEFDTNSNFDTTNYRFTPTVAGYYQINAASSCAATTAWGLCRIYKNGTEFKDAPVSTSAVGQKGLISSLVYLNGSTDYVEFYLIQASGSTSTINPGSTATWFNGALVRAA